MATYKDRLLLVDGFAGPGRYAGGEEGSPLIMIKAFLEHSQREMIARTRLEHVGLVLAGRDAITTDRGDRYELGPGDVFAIQPGHDSEVIGSESYVSLHIVGADEYASPSTSEE